MELFVWRKDSLIYYILLWLFPVMAILSLVYGVNLASYYDELMVVIGFLLCILKIKHILSHRVCSRLLLLLSALVVIGVISNIFSGIGIGFRDILLDCIALTKRWIIFLMFFTISEDAKHEVVIKSRILCKIVIVVVFLMSILAQFISYFASAETVSILGITIKGFGFLWNNGAQTIWLLSGALLLLLREDESKAYVYMWAITTMLTLKTTGYLFVVLFFGIKMLLNKREEISKTQIVVLAGLILITAYSAIQTYFVEDLTSPRLVLILYGFVTANSYFPLGSGFGTYGSAVANNLYSPLYLQYGFQGSYALSNYEGGGGVLNDNYLGMIVGQFGYVGLLITIAMYFVLYIYLNRKRHGGINQKVFTLAIYFTILSTMIASATANSMMGVWVFAVLGIVSRFEDEALYFEEGQYESSSNYAN